MERRLPGMNGHHFTADMNDRNQKFIDKTIMTAFPYDLSGNNSERRKGKLVGLIPEDITKKIYEIANQSELGVYMILLSGVKYILSRYAMTTKVVVGTPNIKLLHSESSSNDLITLRSELTRDMTVREWLSVIKQSVVEGVEHQEVPFAMLAEQAGLIREKKVMLETLVVFRVIQNDSAIERVSSNIVFHFDRPEASISVVLEYEEKFYYAETIEHILDSLLLYYESILYKPDQQLKDINLMSKRSEELILNHFNSPRVTYSTEELTVHELFEQQVRVQPNRTALVYENEEITYQQLNDTAEALARTLGNNLCINGNEPVAVYIDRSPNVYAAMLAIFKVGAIFVPIDPSVPPERMKSILHEGQIRTVLTHSNFIDFIDSLKEEKLIDRYVCIDDQKAYAVQESNTRYKNRANDQIAYIIFTSGTTGKPKGVAVEQKSIVQFLHAIDQIIKPVSPKVSLNAASISFDLFITESLYALYRGMKIVIASEREHKDPIELTRLLENNNVELMMITPSRLQMMISYPVGARTLSKVKMFLIGGQELKQRFFEQLQSITRATIVNVYGPTEATCLTTASLLNGETEVTIGRPLQNYQCYIMDECDRLQLVGAVGELVIGGSGIARGYVNNPQLTAEKFISDPYHANQRLYRTGDLARWLPNGKIQYLGRMDNQVKIRGYRIEINEIESSILSNSDIREAVVTVGTNSSEEQYLSAYIVSDKKWTHKEMHEFLKSMLPEYMVPKQFVQVEELPLTANGKIDFTALHKLEHLKLINTEYRAPSNDIQKTMAEVWRELLDVDRVGIDDNFFQIGGTSLSGVKMVALLSDRYSISINDLFAHPTIAELSTHVIEQEGYFIQMLNMMQQPTDISNTCDLRRAETEMLLRSYGEKVRQTAGLELTSKKHYAHVLLTGGTGFLGSHVLYELLDTTDAQITLVLRASSDETSKNRLLKTMEHYFEDEISDFEWDRVSVVVGDITQLMMGLDAERYRFLAESVDCIIHTAALNRHYGTATEFRATNVDGTREVIEFAMKHRPKDLHYISSMSVGTGSNIKLFDEYVDDVNLDNNSINNHFLTSKAEAEHLIRRGRHQGLSCTIYRLNSLNNNTRTKKSVKNKESNAFYSFISGLNKLGIYPDLSEPVLDLTGVDEAAKAILTLFNRPELHNLNHHIFNPNRISWGQFGLEMKSRIGNIELVRYDEFIRILSEKFNNHSTRNEVINVVLNLFLLRKTEWLGYMRVCDRTELYLNRLGFYWGEIGPHQLDGYVKFTSCIK